MFDHPLLALAVAAELLSALALGADAGFLLSTVQAARRVAAIVPARVVRRLATLRTGGIAADRLRGLRALALLAFTQFTLRIVLARLCLLRLHARGVAAGAAARLLRALGLLPLRLLALGGLSLLTARILVTLAAERALAFGCVRACARLLLLRLVATARFLAALAFGLLAHAALALVGRRARLRRALGLRWRRLGALALCRPGLRLLCARRLLVSRALRGGNLAPRLGLGAARFLAALLARIAFAAAVVLRRGGKRARQREPEDQRMADEDSGGKGLLHRCHPMPTNRSAQA
ncbi:hypothetical protein FQY83_00445 [Luteimonas marina]|uniref:Uncharacterized protein n=1 Tax=Luteimonas marina TaxID=488485 RepID=A0A5C5U9Q2_9GAMM|nr:hypothetical protein [Luteimonas marina]TWT23161.1 hypothetical protein FQY83_00445 [Luteimonas marina]